MAKEILLQITEQSFAFLKQFLIKLKQNYFPYLIVRVVKYFGGKNLSILSEKVIFVGREILLAELQM